MTIAQPTHAGSASSKLRSLAASTWVYLGLLAVFPAVMFAFFDSWTYMPPFGAVDAYIYTGYFLDLKGHIETFRPLYYSSRLPWLMYGSVFYETLSPRAADVALSFSLFYISVFSCFVLVRNVWKSNIAAFSTALILGTHTHFLSSINWTYVNGFIISLTFLSLACLSSVNSGKHDSIYVVLAGFFLVAAVTVQPFAAFIALVVVLWHLARTGSRFNLAPLRTLGTLAAGGCLALLSFGLFNHFVLDGQILYFLPQLDATRNDALFSPWNRPISTWINGATWLLYPGIAVLVSLAVVLLCVSRSMRQQPLGHLETESLYASLAAIAAGIVFLALQFFTSVAVLQYQEYVSQGLPLFFMGLAAAIALATSRLSTRSIAVAALLLPLLLLAPLTLSLFRFLPPCEPYCNLSGGTMLWGLAVLAFLIVAALYHHALVLVLTVIMLASVNVHVALSRWLPIPDSDTSWTLHSMIFDANESVRNYNRDGELRYWFDMEDEMRGVFIGLASLHLFNHRLVSGNFPDVSATQGTGSGEVAIGRNLAILTSSSQDPVALADLTLAQLGLQALTLGKETVTRDGMEFSVVFIRPVPRGLGTGFPLRTEDFRQAAYGKQELTRAGLRVSTAPTKWAYGSILELPAELLERYGSQAGFIELRVRVDAGRVAFGVLNTDGSDFLVRDYRSEADEEQTVFLRVDRLVDASSLVVQNWNRPVRGEVLISSVAFRPQLQEAKPIRSGATD